ncbi:MAG: hypothetical protein QG613_490, partial [Pseudomonadota bacterium]|nr:hypothetical protein [Pseudomonadota bacterium]
MRVEYRSQCTCRLKYDGYQGEIRDKRFSRQIGWWFT